MNQKDIAVVVQKLKEKALASPWEPLGVPPRQHFHKFPNGLNICFTLDILPGTRFWHLSIARMLGSLAPEEIKFWRHAFFDEEPTIELPSQILGLASWHFHWRYKDAAT